MKTDKHGNHIDDNGEHFDLSTTIAAALVIPASIILGLLAYIFGR